MTVTARLEPAKAFRAGCQLMQESRLPEAMRAFLAVLDQRPDHAASLVNLATCHLQLGAIQPAKYYYRQALDLTPHDPQILFNLGVIYAQLGETGEAVHYYQRTLSIHPDDFPAHYNLALILRETGRIQDAVSHLLSAKNLQPDHQTVQYLLQTIAADTNASEAPKNYLTDLFDDYADHYDDHLQKALQYTLPEKMLQSISAYLQTKPAYAILDIGCGTGLCGAHFRPFAKTLTGIDLSEKMLSHARSKNIYDALVAGDFREILSDNTQKYDLILAGDVLVYFGELAEVFGIIFNALSQQGIFVFNTETHDEPGWKIKQSGRFGHNKQDLLMLAQKTGFEVLCDENITGRIQNDLPVAGNFYVFGKP